MDEETDPEALLKEGHLKQTKHKKTEGEKISELKVILYLSDG
jgi:hypothetical protein